MDLVNFQIELCRLVEPIQCMWIAAAIGAAAGLVGSLIGKKGKDKTNSTNLQIAREQNQTNRDIARENNEWNYMMQQEQNAYNSPVNQMQRYKDAGVNPYMAIGNMTAGNQESALTAEQPQQNALPQMDYTGQDLADSISKSAATFLDLAIESQVLKGHHLENEFNVETFKDRAKKIEEEAKSQGYTSRSLAVQARNDEYFEKNGLNDLTVNQAKAELANMNASTYKLQADAYLSHCQASLSQAQYVKLEKYVNEFMPVELENLKKQGKKIDQEIITEMTKQALNRSNVRLNDAQASEIRQLIEYKVASLDLQNQLADNAVEVSNATLDSDIEGKNAENHKKGLLKYQTSWQVGNKALGGSGSTTSYRENDVTTGKKTRLRSRFRKRMVMKNGKYSHYETYKK